MLNMVKEARGVRNGIQRSVKIPVYFASKANSVLSQIKLEYYRRLHSIPYQKPKINALLETDEFILVILDACRFDVFKQMYDGYLRGDITKTWSTARWTGEYIHNCWEGYNDLTYINTAPVISKFYFNTRVSGPDPSEYFRELIQLWKTDWDPETGTVPADAVTDTAISLAAQSDQIRLVAHYMQPHLPYIGEYGFDIWENKAVLKDRIEGDLESPTSVYIDAIESGAISLDELWKAYEANLKYVLPEIRRLVKNVDCPVVVTADHGENLGEKGQYFHEENSRYTRVVPWLIVDPDIIGTNRNSNKDYNRNQVNNIEDKTIEDRLESLGYIDH